MTDGPILITDDDALIRYMIRFGLEQEGFTVYEAVDGLDALDKVAQHRPKLVIMDVMMPRMDGITACRTLRQNAATAALPIVILSARVTAQDKEEIRQAGATAYLSKPLTLINLCQVVRNILSPTTAVTAEGNESVTSY